MGSGTILKQQLDQLMPLSIKTSPSELPKVEDFSDIILTDEETAEALRMGREEKFYRLRREEYAAKLEAPTIKKYSYEETFDFISQLLTIDSDCEEVVRLLCMYFSGDDRFELEGFSLAKGLCIFGGVGVGKTTIMERFFQNQVQSYVVLKCRQIEDEFAEVGDKIFRSYSVPRKIATNSDKFGHQSLGYCFDDLGTEPISKWYGKDVNVMAEIILNRYDNRLPFNQTHITTNLSVDEIKARYGTRVTDRMREMFNLIIFPEGAKSRR